MLQDDGTVKIADFGIARVSQFSGLTQTFVPRGSPGYMAPEQWRGEPVTGNADQYALATVACLLLAGRPPFEGESFASLAGMSLYQDPTNPRAWNDRGTVRLKKGGYKHAIDCFTKAIELDPNLAQAWKNRAAAERKLQDTEAASADQNHALALKQRQAKP